uniref:50S ribosomal protein L13 n=1 Tax=Bicosoecida sp. CB-2014 TaxID=1486930 RepID=A0A7S1CFC1_9STRA|mmetsp:Transcript_22375/g.78399  ORF Transcript_22375/g.78399 Transcript_22375/m.78399 type:complete len:245 (+) Transcript_22375:33-767(+)|eukprot:CAMPEP_0203807468 /NCGR_PEP_ID=MMETSP0115-20131106/1090_1 /ASSEMBLY_ACC=CAM_ASM_000227 /TAXON_ID=33651 /ORGANISM="Bicosoecid sp, Strain ms1" /LENGTH=244 /DNA_ID=CAMNT_0050716149 /DNA_START=35 /DNA_END=769 /DNA_ORIENTATION=-
MAGLGHMSRVAAEQRRVWHLVDARDQVVGRLASQIGRLLTGKHKPTYVPHIDCGDHVVVVNASQVAFTGKKRKEKLYRWHTGYPGGLKTLTARQVFERAPDRVLKAAVSGMLPKNTLRPHRLRRLRIYGGEEGLERYHSQLVGSARGAEEFVDAVAPHGMAPKPKPITGDLARDWIPESVAERIGEEAYAGVRSYRALEDKFGITADDVEFEHDSEYEEEMRALYEAILAEEAAAAADGGDELA